MLQQNATNVQQIATQGGGDRAPMSVVQRLSNLFVLQTNFTDLSVKLETVQIFQVYFFQSSANHVNILTRALLPKKVPS